MSQSKIIEAALKYAANGFSVIPTDQNKRSIITWKPYQETIATPEKVKEMFTDAYGLAVVCGKVSGGLEVIDVDSKYDLTGTLFEEFIQAITDVAPELVPKLVIATTKGKGYHLYYRCENIEGNQKLANRETTEEERKDNPHEKVKVLIETRGNLGYIIAAPTEGYKFIQGQLKDCISISPEEREIILQAARSFNQYHEPVREIRREDAKEYSASPFDDFNKRGDAVALLERHGWQFHSEKGGKTFFTRPGKSTRDGISGDYWHEKKWFAVFTTSSQFDPNKAYSPAALFTILECNNDWKEAARRLIADGFGKKRVFIDKKYEKLITNKRDGGATDEMIKHSLIAAHNISEDQAGKILDDFNTSQGEDISTFWSYNRGSGKLEFSRNKFLSFLSEVGGFYLYFYEPKKYRIIQDNNGLIEEATIEEIKKFILNYINELPVSFDGTTRETVLEMILKGGQIYFSEAVLEFLERKEIDFLKDTAKTAYFPFINGVVCVTATECKLKTYGELNKYVWKDHVINFAINVGKVEFGQVDFFHFIRLVCANDKERIARSISIAGYLLHKYKDPTKSFSIILGEETEDEREGGGTGKGIFINAISKLCNTEVVDGKNFKVEKTFAFQRASIATRIIAIQDVRKNLDFEGFYSIITEGITIERKNKDEIYIPYADSPKIVFTTNYTVNTSSNHAKRRVKLIEFSNHFSPRHTPMDHFGYTLFDDWDNDQWAKFYNFMFLCTQVYLESGIPDIEESESSKRKTIRLAYGEEFMSFFEEYATNGCREYKFLNDLHKTFLSLNDFDKKDYSSKRFSRGIEDAAKIFELGCKKNTNRQAGGRIEVKLENQLPERQTA